MPFPLDLATFADRYPEFAPVVADRPTYVQSKLDDAETEIDVTVWGDKAERGHGLLTAHLLAMSPYGANAALRSKDGTTSIYAPTLEELQRSVGTAYRVVLE